MEIWDGHRMRYIGHNGQRACRHHRAHHSRNQSFSSLLFDAICRSTDDVEEWAAYKKCSNREGTRNVEAEEKTSMGYCNYKSISRLERLRDKDHTSAMNNEKLMRGRSAKVGLFNAEKYEDGGEYSKCRSEFPLLFQSTIAPSRSSDYVSDSTNNCPYLSYDAESFYRHSSSIFPGSKPENNSNNLGHEDRARKWAVSGEFLRDFHGNSLVRDAEFGTTQQHFIPADHHAKIMSKSKSCKDSMKSKHPISSGNKLTNFLNSLFMGGGARKKNLSSSYSVTDSNSDDSAERKPSSSYSSSSSFQSKPCLSKTSGRSKNNDGVKRCVTFYPTSVIVDENSRPCGEKYLHGMGNPEPHPNPSNYRQITHPSTEADKLPLLSEKLNHRSVEEAGQTVAATSNDIAAKYPKPNSIIEGALIRDLDKRVENEEDNDDGSCSSSDLFELESLEVTHYHL